MREGGEEMLSVGIDTLSSLNHIAKHWGSDLHRSALKTEPNSSRGIRSEIWMNLRVISPISLRSIL